jgi:pilus assembly protein CpaE
MSTLRVWTSGEWSDLANFRAQLGGQPSIELVGEEPHQLEPDVVVHVTRDAAQLATEIAHVREHARGPIVLLTSVPSHELLEEAVRLAVADVLPLPQAAEAVAFAVLKASREAQLRPGGRGSGRIATVFSPKGGTGKTVTATNLAVSLAEHGHRTLLVDLDLQFGDVAIMLGLQPDRTLHDLMTSPGRLDGEKLRGYVTRHGSGLQVLAAPLRPEDAEEITDTRVAELLDVATHEYAFVVVDTAPFLYGPTLETLDRTNDLFLLCAPDVPSLKNVRLTLQTLDLLGFDDAHVKLVLNRASARVGLRAAEVGTVLDRPVDVELPEDELVIVSVNRALPLVQFRPGSPFAVALAALLTPLLGEEEPAAERPPKRMGRFALGRPR